MTISEGEQGAYQVELGVDGARVTIAEAPTELLSQLYGFCGEGGAGCVAETLLDPPPELDAYPEVAAVLEELDSSAITRDLRDRVLAENEYDDLEAALSYVTEHGGCLVVDVAAIDGAVDWRYGTPGEDGCS